MASTRNLGAKARAADAILSAAVLLALWKLGSLAVGIDMVLPPPERVFSVLQIGRAHG